MCYIPYRPFLAPMILGITLLVSFSCSAQKNTTYPTEKGIFDQNGEYKGDAFFCLDEIETLVDTIIAEGKRKRRHYVMQYPDGKGNVYRFGKSHKYAGLYWFNSYNRYQVYRGYYLDTGTIYTKKTELGDTPIGKEITYTKEGKVESIIDYEADFSTPLEEIIALCREKFNVDLEYKVPVNPSEIEFKRMIYKQHPDFPKAYILSFSSKEEKEDNKKRFIVIKDGTKEVVMDKLINRRIETPDGKDLIKVEEAYIPDKEIIKALLFLKK